MIDLTTDPASAADALRDRLAEGRAWVVVFRDRALAAAFDEMAGGGLRGVILAASPALLAEVLPGDGLDAETRAVALSARSGQIVDVVPGGEEVDPVRIFEAFVRAESM
jgi:hypothetical protein